ncbi:NAD(P)-dependent oxidoreductase [Leptospirillum ferriphilum]|uniref:NAD(P)-dependent oxidoreductase n=1 Tax=Leptospirillum ferriphilum TaxID=178606 RepID=UPI003EE4513F
MSGHAAEKSPYKDAVWIGTGNMGLPMAKNLLRSGIHLSVHNRTPQRLAPLLTAGAHAIADLPGSLSRTPLVFTMLADDAAVKETVTKEGGLLDSLPEGGVHVSMGTLSPGFVEGLSKSHAERGQILVSAPVFGRPDRAEAGTLTIVSAGPQKTLESLLPLLEEMGSPVFCVGEDPSLANHIKVLGNFTLAGLLETLAESLSLARRVGVSPEQLVEILDTALYRSPVFKNYGQLMARENFEPAGFRMRLGLKDVRLVQKEADRVDVALPLADLLHAGFLAGIHRGMDDWDWSALGRVRAEDAGAAGRR